MITRVVEGWVEEPLKRFVDDARVVLALMLHPSGQVMAQYGFARAMDVMSACALAAAIHASASELGRQLDGKPFSGIHQAGKDRQLFLAEAETAQGSYIFVTVFDAESSLGLVRLYFEELRAGLAAAAPALQESSEPILAEHFESELNRNLAALFGRA